MRRSLWPILLVACWAVPTAGIPEAGYRPGDAVWIDLPVEPWSRDFGYATGVVESASGTEVRVAVRRVVPPEAVPDAVPSGRTLALEAGEVAAVPARHVSAFRAGRAAYRERRDLLERFDRALGRLPAWVGEPGGAGRVDALAEALRRAGLGASADQLEIAWHMTGVLQRGLAGHDPRAPPGAEQLEAIAGRDAFRGLTREIERLGLAAPVREALNSVALEAPWVGRRLVQRGGRTEAIIHAEPRSDRSAPAPIADAGTHAAILALGRTCQLMPFEYLSGPRVEVSAARAVIAPILHRCLDWVTESGRRLPPGVSVADAVARHADAMLQAHADPSAGAPSPRPRVAGAAVPAAQKR